MSSASPPERPPASGAPRLAGSLTLIAPWLPAELVAPAALERLSSVAGVLPPVHRADFECRLGAGAGDAGLRQGILIADGEPGRVARFLAAEPPNDDWTAVRRTAERLSAADDPLHDAVAELWLGLGAPAQPTDDTVARAPSSAPTVLAVLKSAQPQRSLESARAVGEAILGESGASGLAGALMLCARACPGTARISQIGLMPGRPMIGLRVSRIPLRALGECLVQIGWTGDLQQVQSLAGALLDQADHLSLCLDVSHDRIVGLGLEFSSDGPRWEALLEGTCVLGLSSAEEADGLLRWPGTVTPLDSPGPWPEDLIAQSLARPEREFGVLERRLRHITLNLVPELPVRASACFGYGHVWTRRPIAGQRSPHRSIRTRASTVSDAIEHAVDCLVAVRHQSGWWRDFRGMGFVDFSDEWVTAYVGDALAGVALGVAQNAAREGLELLLTARERTCGWGFNALLPPDGDATTWVLRLARSLDAPEHARLAGGRRLLESLTGPDGGVTSYALSAVALLDRITRIGGSYDGYRTAHTCISASAAILGISASTLSYLRGSQKPNGAWSSYWWETDEYATAWAVQALTTSVRDRTRVSAAATWCASRLGEDGAVRAVADGEPSAFATALVLHAIRTGAAAGGGDHLASAAERARRWLLKHQLGDGSWKASARLRVPRPSTLDPSASPELILDYTPDSGVWTTATVVAALAADSRSRR
jgi:hypothetical protein